MKLGAGEGYDKYIFFQWYVVKKIIKNADNKCSAHDAFLEYPSSGQNSKIWKPNNLKFWKQ